METSCFLYYYFVFLVEKTIPFFGHTSPLLPPLSGAAHSECDVSKPLGEADAPGLLLGL